MNWEQIRGDWKQFTGQMKSKWGKLTDDDLMVIAGKREQLIGKLETRYGVRKEEAERQVDEWTKGLSASPSEPAKPSPYVKQTTLPIPPK